MFGIGGSARLEDQLYAYWFKPISLCPARRLLLPGTACGLAGFHEEVLEIAYHARIALGQRGRYFIASDEKILQTLPGIRLCCLVRHVAHPVEEPRGSCSREAVVLLVRLDVGEPN